MQTIIHISADFPDPLVPAKTRAVANLLDAAPGFRHVVYSLNRVSWRKGVSQLAFAEDRVALAYGAPPYGIGLAGHLRPVAAAIRDDLIHRRVDPDVIHAHKFSVEGLVAAELSAELRLPFIASLWGDTDIKIFEAKPTLRGRYREIADRAAMLLPAAPWTADYFAKALSLGPDRFEILPVITAADAILPPRAIGRPQLVTVLSLDSWRRKGLDTLMRAAVLLKPKFPDLLIDVYGSGSPGSLMEVTRMIDRTGAGGQMRLLGPTAHGAVQRTINGYAAFVMPTRRETYGMVHLEAVLAGVPILWSRERGIDGLMDDGQVGYRCDPTSVEDVAAGIAFLLNREVELKRRISRLQSTGAFEPLRRPAVAARYRGLLEQTLGNTAGTADFPNLQKVESL